MITIPELNYQFALLVTLTKGYIDLVASSEWGVIINIVGFVLDAMLAYVLVVRISASNNSASVNVSMDSPSTSISDRNFDRRLK